MSEVAKNVLTSDSAVKGDSKGFSERKQDKELTFLIERAREADPKLANLLELYANFSDMPNELFIELINFMTILSRDEKALDKGTELYRLKLKVMMTRVMDDKTGFFKVEEGLKNDPDVLREILHAILGVFPEFFDYFKYKIKGAAAGTDYRVPVKEALFNDKEAKLALENLLTSNTLKQAAKGSEQVAVVGFPNLSDKDFSTLCSQCSEHFYAERSSVIRHINLPERKQLILILLNYNSSTLDLHGFNVKIALVKAREYIRNTFIQFKDKATLITGQGKHSKWKRATLAAFFLKFLKREKENDPNFISRLHYSTGRLHIDFHPPVEVDMGNLPQAIAAREHRILVKLDKAYSPTQLEERATLLSARTIMAIKMKGLVAEGIPQTVEPSNYLRLFFSYGNRTALCFHSFSFDEENTEKKKNGKEKKK